MVQENFEKIGRIKKDIKVEYLLVKIENKKQD